MPAQHSVHMHVTQYVNIGKYITKYVRVTVCSWPADSRVHTGTGAHSRARALSATAGALQRQEVQGCDWSGWAHEVQREPVLAGLLGNRNAWHSGEHPRRAGVHGAPLQNVSLSRLGWRSGWGRCDVGVVNVLVSLC